MNPRPSYSSPDPEPVRLGLCDVCLHVVLDTDDFYEDDDVLAHQSCWDDTEGAA